MARVRTDWTGFVGAPGYTNFFFQDFSVSGAITQAEADGVFSKVNTFWNAVKGFMPDDVTLTVNRSIDVIESTTGELVGSFSVATAAPAIVGGGAGTYAAPSGGVVSWRTPVVRNGRRIRGRTFLVPLVGTSFGNGGQLAPSVVTTITSSATALAAEAEGLDFGIWARPTAPGASDGVWARATSAIVPTSPAVLRSRRD